MNTSPLRGFAVLALFVLAPLRAATIVQTASFQVSADTIGVHHAGTTIAWSYTPFDPALGTLESVTFNAVATATVRAFNTHQYGIMPFPPYTPPPPMVFTPYTALLVTAYPSSHIIPLYASDYSYGEPTLVEAFGGFSHTATHTVTVSETTSASNALARYSDTSSAGAWIIVQGEGYGRYGAISFDGSVQTTLTYNYNVPDVGNAAFLLAFALAGIGGFCRRLVRV